MRDQGRLAFEYLQNRLYRCGATAASASEQMPAHFVAFDVLRLTGTVTTGWPCQRRRAGLESVFTTRRLTAPFRGRRKHRPYETAETIIRGHHGRATAPGACST